MAKSTIKGLTVKIGGDTSELTKALEDVNKKSRDLSSELGQVNRLLKMDPGNAELVAQKQKILAEAIENTGKKLDTLKEAERQVQEQFERGEVSAEQVRALQREIVATEQKLKGYKNAAQEVADGNDKIASTAKEAAQEVADANESMYNMAKGGLTALTGAITGAVTGLVAAAEASREYRGEMGKLDAAFSAQNYNSTVAKDTYKELVSIIGETDQSVEAAQQIALLAESEKDVAKWAGLASGVVGTFGDALQPETFFEAANETIKLGEATGAYVQMLEGTGMSVEAFNEGLANCNTEAEKQAYMLETTQQALGAAGAAYEKNNADVIAANAASESWRESMAQLGAAVEPVVTKVKEMGATLVTELVPVVQTLLNNLPAIGVALAGITASMVAFKVAQIAATAATKGMTLAQYAAAAAQSALNVVMNANPIGLVILAITALVATFMVLWKNSDAFRKFWQDMWKKVQEAASAAIGWLKGLPGRLWSAISGAIGKVSTWGSNLSKTAKQAASNMLSTVVSTLTALPGRIWSAISGALSSVTRWGSDMASRARTAMSNLISAVTSTLASLPGKVLSIGGDLVTGLWNGVSNKLSWIKSKLSGFASSVLSSIKSFFGVHSPSTETAWIGEMLDEGLAEGVLDNAKTPVKAMQKVSGGVLDAASNVNGLTLGQNLQSNFAGSAGAEGLGAKLDKILVAIERGQIIAIDGDKLVGATADRMDRRLGQRRILAARGAL